MHPLVVVCVQGLGPQLVQVTISFGPVVAPVGGPPSRFFLPCDRVSVEETYILTYIFSMLNNDPSFDQLLLFLLHSTPLSVLFFFSFPFLFPFDICPPSPFVPFRSRFSKRRRRRRKKKKGKKKRSGGRYDHRNDDFHRSTERGSVNPPPPPHPKVENVKKFRTKLLPYFTYMKRKT